MEDWTIAEDFKLPSNGEVYDKEVNPNIKLRSMTTEEEMRRLGHSPYIYKMFSNIIDDCIVGEKPGISAYDMCVGDYQFLMYKLRTVTYGSDYEIDTICPYCGEANHVTVNLDNLRLNSFDSKLKSLMEFDLPVTKKKIKLKMQTPRMLDEVQIKTKELERKSPSIDAEPALLFNVMSLIDTVDGEKLPENKLDTFVRKLPMRDTNVILQNSRKLVLSIGFDTTVHDTCKHCKHDYDSLLPITGEFFGPSNY